MQDINLKREDIKQCLIGLLDKWGRALLTETDQYPEFIVADRILDELNNRDVAIKVDRDTPYSEYVGGIFDSKKKSQMKECIEKNDIYEKAQVDMLDAGYVAVESLIGERMINCEECGKFISHDWSNLPHICSDCKSKKGGKVVVEPLIETP